MQQFIFDKNLIIAGTPVEILMQLKLLSMEYATLLEFINGKMKYISTPD